MISKQFCTDYNNNMCCCQYVVYGVYGFSMFAFRVCISILPLDSRAGPDTSKCAAPVLHSPCSFLPSSSPTRFLPSPSEASSSPPFQGFLAPLPPLVVRRRPRPSFPLPGAPLRTYKREPNIRNVFGKFGKGYSSAKRLWSPCP